MKWLAITLLFLTYHLSAQDPLEEARILRAEGNYAEAIQVLQDAFHKQDTLTKLKFQDQMSTLHSSSLNYDEAFRLKEIAVNGFKVLGNDTLTSKSLYGLYKFYSDRYDYETGYPHLLEALEYAQTRVDSARILSNMGVYQKYHGTIDSAKALYLLGIEMYPKEEDPFFYTVNYNNLALLEKKEGNLDQALEYYDVAIGILNDQGEEVRAASTQVNKSYIYYDQEKYEKAEALLNRYDGLIMSKGETLDKLNFDLIRYNIAQELGKTSETLRYYQRYRRTKDSVDNLKLNTRIAEFEVKYETADKEREIAVQQGELAQSKVRQQYLWGGLLGALWLGLFGTLFYWSRNRYQRRINEEKMRSLAVASMLDGQEKERMRIAADLHDSLGGLLTTIKLHFENMQERVAEWAGGEKREDVTRLLDRASSEVRRISHNMAPRALNLSGLNAALADLSTEINATGSVKVSYEWHGDEVPEQDRIMVYRIVEEACGNALKYAEASHLIIQVNVFSGGYSVMVEDDGKGFLESKVQEGMGLRNMRSRASILKAELDIDSRKGEGTTISLNVSR